MPGDAPAGLCLACLLHAGLSLLTQPGEKSGSTAQEQLTDDDLVGVRVGHYHLREKIGEGGCGVVYLAEQEAPVRRWVALKIIKLGMDTRSVIGRFEAERQTLALMDHPNIAKVFDAGSTVEGRPYFVMEWVQGARITDYCDRHQLPTRERLELFIQVCQAVQHAHQKGVIHRDLKPSNILVTCQDPGSPAVPKVIDFGIAKAMENRLTGSTVHTEIHQFLGTPAYMSPEQAAMNGADIDTRSDIYSLGVLLYELLTGHTPFDTRDLAGRGLDEVLRAIREAEPGRPSTRLGKLPADQLAAVALRRRSEALRLVRSLRGDLDWIVIKCLRKDRRDRYQTTNGLAADLKRYLAHEPVLARPPSARYTFAKLARRHRAVLLVSCVATLGLVLAAVMGTEQAVRAHAALRQVNWQRQRAESSELRARRLLYAANINLAAHKYERNDFRGLRQLLAETANYPDRGFEWHYLSRLAHAERLTFQGHSRLVTRLAVAPDGRWLASGDVGGCVKIWDPATGRELRTCQIEPAQADEEPAVWALAFSPDGCRLAVGTLDGRIRVEDVAGGQALLCFRAHEQRVWSLVYSADSRQLFSAGVDGTIKSWDAEGNLQRTYRGHRDAISCMELVPPGDRLATGGWDGSVRLWDATQARELLCLQAGPSKIRALAVSADGRRLVAGDLEGRVRVWDLITGEPVMAFKADGYWVGDVAFSLDQEQIITGGGERTIRVWEAGTGKELYHLKGHSAGIESLCWLPRSQRLASCGDDLTVKIWDLESRADRVADREPAVFETRPEPIRALAFSPDSRTLAAGRLGLGLWDVQSGREVAAWKPQTNWVRSVAFSADGTRIVAGGSDRTARVIEVSSGRELLCFRAHDAQVKAARFRAHDRQIVSVDEAGMVRLWDACNGLQQGHFRIPDPSVRAVALAPDASRLAACSDDGNLRIWELATQKKALSIAAHRGGANTLVFSADGRRLLSAGNDGKAVLWDALSGQELLTIELHCPHPAFALFSPDSRRLLVQADDYSANLVDALTGREVLTLRDGEDLLLSAAFSPDGQTIAMGTWTLGAAEAGHVKLWRAGAWPERAVGASPKMRLGWQ